MLKFNLNDKGFNLNNAYSCCLLSDAAYLPKELIGHKLIEEWGMTSVSLLQIIMLGVLWLHPKK